MDAGRHWPHYDIYRTSPRRTTRPRVQELAKLAELAKTSAPGAELAPTSPFPFFRWTPSPDRPDRAPRPKSPKKQPKTRLLCTPGPPLTQGYTSRRQPHTSDGKLAIFPRTGNRPAARGDGGARRRAPGPSLPQTPRERSGPRRGGRPRGDSLQCAAEWLSWTRFPPAGP